MDDIFDAAAHGSNLSNFIDEMDEITDKDMKMLLIRCKMIGVLRSIFDDDILCNKIESNNFDKIHTIDDCKDKIKQSTIYLEVIKELNRLYRY